jgi:hypothetical protein
METSWPENISGEQRHEDELARESFPRSRGRLFIDRVMEMRLRINSRSREPEMLAAGFVDCNHEAHARARERWPWRRSATGT